MNIYGKLLRIVAKVSGRIFIGPELCRSEKYIDTASKSFTTETLPLTEALCAVVKRSCGPKFSACMCSYKQIGGFIC